MDATVAMAAMVADTVEAKAAAAGEPAAPAATAAEASDIDNRSVVAEDKRFVPEAPLAPNKRIRRKIKQPYQT